MKCCICGKDFIGYGNNPAPVKDKGRCCDDCNIHIVIPTRVQAMLFGPIYDKGQKDEIKNK